MLVLTENFITLRQAQKGEGRGREKSAKVQKGPLPSLPNLPPFSPSSLSPTAFNACYSGHTLSLEPHIIHVGPTHF